MVQGVDSCVNYVSKEDIPWKIRQKKICHKKILSKEVRRYVKREDAPWKMIPYTCDTTSASLDTPHGAPRER